MTIKLFPSEAKELFFSSEGRLSIPQYFAAQWALGKLILIFFFAGLPIHALPEPFRSILGYSLNAVFIFLIAYASYNIGIKRHHDFNDKGVKFKKNYIFISAAAALILLLEFTYGLDSLPEYVRAPVILIFLIIFAIIFHNLFWALAMKPGTIGPNDYGNQPNFPSKTKELT